MVVIHVYHCISQPCIKTHDKAIITSTSFNRHVASFSRGNGWGGGAHPYPVYVGESVCVCWGGGDEEPKNYITMFILFI